MEQKHKGTDVNQIKVTNLSCICGQPQVINKLNVHLSAYLKSRSGSKSTGSSFGPVLLTGPSGTGKSMTAKAIHLELRHKNIIETNGVTMNTKAELYSTFLNANDDTTIFVDEVHGVNRKTQLVFLTAISERTLRVPAGPSTYHSIPLANFTLIMATTHEYLLLAALRNRVRIECRFKHYSQKDLIGIVRQRTKALMWNYESDKILETIAKRAKGNPRQALHRNLQMCWNVAVNNNHQFINFTDLDEAFGHLQIDELGLEQTDRDYLRILYGHGPLALGVLSSRL